MASKNRSLLILGAAIVVVLAIFIGRGVAKNRTLHSANGKIIFNDTKVGAGAEAKFGDRVSAHYKIQLRKTNTVLADTHQQPHQAPASFEIGRKQVLEGIEQATIGMHVGGVREAWIPSNLAYGSAGVPPMIPANSDLDVEIELLDVASSHK